MGIEFMPEADAFEERLRAQRDPAYDKLWDVIDRIEDDAESAKTEGWVKYVSTQNLWGAKVPGTDLTVFWRTVGDVLEIHLIVDDPGI